MEGYFVTGKMKEPPIPKWLKKDEKATCPSCKRKVTVTTYICYECGGTYQRMGKMFRNRAGYACDTCGRVQGFGRPRVFRFTCPRCGEVLQSIGVPEFALQLVGGSSSGKTTFLAAFWHLYRARMAQNHPDVTLRLDPEAMFERLEDNYQRGVSEATSERNAITYGAIHNRYHHTCQLSCYDIAGEVFVEDSYEGEQGQFAYCDGFIVVIDPLNAEDVRRENGIEDMSATYSRDDVDGVIGGFCNKFSAIRALRANERSHVPVSVIITKADVSSVKRAIGPDRVRAVADSQNKGGEMQARDALCRVYLREIGLDNALNNLEARFANLHFFPVSAVGQDLTPGTPYAPWGVMEAVDWMLWDQEKPLRKTLRI